MTTLTATRGLPGSGKSTWANKCAEADAGIRVVNRDTIRRENGLTNFSQKNEKKVREIRDELIIVYLNQGFSVINDDTNLALGNIKHFQQMAKMLGAEFVLKDSFLQVEPEECFKRDLMREHSVGKDVIERMWYEWKRQTPTLPNAGPREAIICDIDGTLSLFGDASPYERDFSKDWLNEPVASILWTLRKECWVLLVSGRDEGKREATTQWLATKGVNYDSLWMRPAGDTRKDYQIKAEIYLREIFGKYHVQFVLDDRPQILRRWRADFGLTTLSLGDCIEF